MPTDWNVHCVPGWPGVASQPSLSLMKAISRLGPSGSSAADRSCQVSPRSVERKSRLPATSAHTTFAEGALSWAVLGSVIGVAETVGEGAGEVVGARVALAEGGAVVGVEVAGGAAQALKRTSRAAMTNDRDIRNMYPV
jgi:hypothetical protein